MLLFDKFSNHCLANAIEPLRAANTLAAGALYRWQVLTLDGAPATSSSGLPVTPECALRSHPGGDYLLVMPSYGHLEHATPATLRALRAAARRFRVLVGMDTGAWLLAAAGLLDDRAATIHWDEYAAFAERFPEVDLRPDRVVTDGDRITCGGATTAFELVLQLIQAHHGTTLRLDVAAMFMHGEWPGGDRSGLRPTGHGRTDAAVALMRRRIEDPLPIAEVARNVGVSQRALETLFRANLGQTAQQVYRQLRLSEARRLLRLSDLPIADIARRCGYGDPGAMTRAFRGAFGLPPSRYRRSA